MAKQKENAVVHSQEQLADGIYSMWINTEAAKDAKPGQFISMYTTDGSKLLPRPISICEIDKELSLIHISEPTRRTPISYAVFCLKKKKQQKPKEMINGN